ncbi:MAG: double-strand break repair protein AddB [Rhodospirillales bacterium]|nr:double-strand break repair protein AddB [Rhodospirillales bacterium]
MAGLFLLPAHRPFLDSIAADWLAESGADPLAVADGLILLPTRRAARAMADAFLRQSQGRALLLPRITALGAADEVPLALAGALDLPPAIAPARRQAELARLVLAFEAARGRRPRAADGSAFAGADAAWRLAGDLAALMDEAEREDVDLTKALGRALAPEAAERHAAHWQETLDFLAIVTEAWPRYLAENGLMNPEARAVALLDAQALAWQAAPPPSRILAAGSTGGIPAIARLLDVIARLKQGRVVLPAIDMAMEEEAWAALPPSHPQAGLARLLAGMGRKRAELREFAAPSAAGMTAAPDRAALLARALHPSGQMAATGEEDGRDCAAALAGLSRLAAADQHAEATAIAMILRAALERPGHRAALVTPDRALARQVAVQLERFGVLADDSAGEALAETPPAVFLRLIAAALAEKLAPVALLSLLKHPLAALGMAPAQCRAAVRALEVAALRGPRPPEGISGLRWALASQTRPGAPITAEHMSAASLLAALERALAPGLRAMADLRAAPAALLAALIATAEALAASDAAAGATRLWSGEEGTALATTLSEALAALPALPDQIPAVLPGLLDALLDGVRVRGRRVLRAEPGDPRTTQGEHPRIFIWGLLEARLQQVDTLVLGGLVESVWPPATSPGPWLSRPMRRAIGLPAPEQAVGQAAHDFVALTGAAAHVVLSCPLRRDGAPAVPARWLQRLDVFLAGRGLALPAHPAAAWPACLDRPAGPARPVDAPRPCPPLIRRPRRLSVTEIETWLADPYAIYVRHILRLRPLDPLEQETDAADFGTLVHEAMRLFLAAHPGDLPAAPEAALEAAFARALQEARLRPALTAWWEPRLARIARFVATLEPERHGLAASIHTECSGMLRFTRPGGVFTLRGRADRIERLKTGGLAILDYKTGTPPTAKAVADGRAPQLPLEALMAAEGAFGEALRGETEAMLYWHLSGGKTPGKVVTIAATPGADGIVPQTRDALHRLIDAYDDPAQPYLSQPDPRVRARFPEYDQLARRAEWSSADVEADTPEEEAP